MRSVQRSPSVASHLLWVAVLATGPQCATRHPDSLGELPAVAGDVPTAENPPRNEFEDWINLLQPVVKLDDPDQTTGFAFYSEETDRIGSPIWNPAATIDFVVTDRLGEIVSKHSLKRSVGNGFNEVPSPALIGGFSAHCFGFVFRLRVKGPPGRLVWMPADESWLLMPKRAGEEPRLIDVTSGYVEPTGLQYLRVIGAQTFFETPMFLVSRVVCALGTESYGFYHEILDLNGKRLWSITFPETIQDARSYGDALQKIRACSAPASQILHPATMRLLKDLTGHYAMFTVTETSKGILVQPVGSFVEE